ncbi:MAG: beta-lactamase family protein [Balneolaceae bacterium]|nr:beta-lactamase family protein [Balneolaceae bacterium]
MKSALWLFAFTTFLCYSCTNNPAIQRLDGSQISNEKLDKQIQSLVDTASVSGLTITIFNDNAITYQKAFGYANVEHKDSLQTDQVFYGASLSKAVFGYLVADLAADSIIDLDKPLQEYLDVPIPEMQFEKEWRGFANLAGDERYKTITARMCLAHTTGLPNWRWISRTNKFTPEGKIHFYFDPGTEYSYSGEGMQLLQYVVENITGKGLEELARQRVFDPLKMNMTSYLWQKRFEGNYANGHTSTQEVIPKDPADEAAAAGSMATTPEDYAKFVQHILALTAENSEITRMMFKPNIRIHSKKQFGAGSMEQTDKNDDIELSYGLGWGLFKTPHGPAAFKEGHGEGFQHYSVIFPEKKTGVIIMSNSDNAESIFKALLEITIGDTYTPWEWEDYIPYDQKEA